MKKLFTAFCLTLAFSVFTFAQVDIKKLDFYVGYSNTQVEADSGNLFLRIPRNSLSNGTTTASTGNFFQRRTGFDGAEIAVAGNLTRFFGIKGDVSGTYRDRQFGFRTATGATTSTNVSFRTKDSLYNFLGGVQFKDNASKAKITPFAHALVGVGYGRTRVRNLNCPSTVNAGVCAGLAVNDSDTGLAAAFGGGLDVKFGSRVGLRLIQVDYNPVHLNGRTLDNVRFGGGITF